MVERRILHAAGLARLLGMLVLLAGVLAMHSAVFGSSGHVHPAGAHAAPASEAAPGGPGRDTAPRHTGNDETGSRHAIPDNPDRATAAGAGTARAIGATMPPHCAGGCDGTHSALHGCVFILAGLIALAALVLLYRMAVDRPGGGAARPRHRRARGGRPPPWTVLTLAELAILRI
ncbi:DUF6153 family protein [Nocardia sp. NPDC057455]|uniref:DUF6153 family protein n=1 Tax=Nocardia sp. NPDC057455 TaxID=3346138 RepID=UPI003670E91B